MDKWIVALNYGKGEPLFLKDSDGTTIIFDSEDDAEIAAQNNALGAARGYEVYPWPYAED